LLIKINDRTHRLFLFFTVMRTAELLVALALWGRAYERLGDKEKAAGLLRARAMNLKQDYDPARQGFDRVGGRFGQNYQTF
jgi:hypothetical protein